MGWYPDPTDPAQERYWEGTRWTHNVRDPQPDGRWSAGLGRPAPAADGAHQRPQAGAPEQSGWGQQSSGQQSSGHQQSGHQQSGQLSPWQQSGQFAGGQGWSGQGASGHGAALRPMTGDGVPLASFGQRLLARMIDWVAVSVVSAPLAWTWLRQYFDIVSAEVSTGRMPNQVELAEKIQGPVSAIALVWVAVMFGYQLLMVGLTSRTLGKMALGLRVVTVGRGQQRVGWMTALLRALIVGVAALGDIWIGVTTVIACLWSLQKPRCQALQDRVARTQVVSTS